MEMTKRTLFVFGLILISSISLQSQGFNLSNPIFPNVNSLADESIGGFAGIGPNWQNGTHYVDCEGCEFIDGTGTGYTFGAIYQLRISQTLFIGGYLSLDFMNISSSYREIENITISAPDNPQLDGKSANVEFRHSADMSLSYVSLAPYLEFNPVGWLSVRAAPKISFPIGSNLVHTKEPTSSRVVVEGIEGIGSLRDETLQDSEVADLTFPLISADLTGMINLTPGEKSTFSLGFTQNIPFNNTSEFGEDFQIFSWRVFVEYKYSLLGTYDYLKKRRK
jgi:hypothetical protein